MKGGAMDSEIQASPTLASSPILSPTCSAGFPDGERARAGHRAPSLAAVQEPGPGEATGHPLGLLELRTNTPLPTSPTGQQLVKINLAVFSFS